MNDETGAGGDVRMAEAINEIEGFLLWEAERERARTRAAEFCARLPWLTTAQREDVAAHYCREQHETTRSYLERVAARSAALRAEYEVAYRTVRRRMVVALLGIGVLEVLALAVLTLTGNAPGVP
ncbi:hypothetical protein ACFC0M_34315 [Streptomyces sp. NPDC056149]|uniref:hypothetical protein n=1 Tax=unclassified Streptomyces TaxID=2593676 RepID=UPI002380E9A5|nr:hypothetical protein [Streptomyces sp. WZ-12]